MSWRGRGQSRGNRGGNRGGFQQRNDFDDAFLGGGGGGSSNSSSSSVLSRLGPMNGGGGGGHQDRFSDNFRSNGPRGGGGGNRSFDNSRQYNDRQYDDRSYNDRRYNDGGGNFNSRGGGRGGFRSDNQRPQQQQSFNRGRGRGGGGGGGRRQYTRKFVDEDIEMGQSINIPPGAIVVSITGHPEGTDDKLLGFLQRKVRVPWEARSYQSSGGTMYIEVGTEDEAEGICRCNNFQFYGVDLKIRREDGGGGNGPRSTQPRRGGGGNSSVLQEFLQERWDPQNGFLSLDELPQTKHGIGLVISKLLSAANDLYGDNVITISFARNGLWSLKPLQSLPDIFPRIQNLSVQDNDIAEFRSLDAFAKRNLPNLTELLLMGNPIQTNNPWERYQSEVLQRFPNVTMLDMQPVGNAPPPPQQGMSPSTSTGFAPTNISTPPQPGAGLPMGAPQVQGSFYDGENSRQATEDFLTKFFPLFDSNRQALVDLYDPQAGFSIGVSSMAAKGSWGQLPRLTMGNENIIKRMLTLPPTIHGLSRPENFVMDAWQTQGSQTHPVILFLTVHGEFNEATGAKGAQYSFDRAMLVAPAIAGSRAQLAGWQYVILSDSLMVRDYTGNMGFRPTA